MVDYIVTGGNGFIGSHLVKQLIKNNYTVLNIDSIKLNGLKENLHEFNNHPNYFYSNTDIRNSNKINKIFNKFDPKIVIHCAAESHVDNSIFNPSSFIESNIFGTYNLLQASLNNWKNKKKIIKFIFVSTDEVYGSLNNNEKKFNENSNYLPNSPYSASKASADHLVRAWNKTYNLPTIITHCTNNYGPYQFPEKLIPNVIMRALKKYPINIYGDGKNIRDWVYVKDHVSALIKISKKGKIGSVYNIGTNNEISNIQLVRKICSILDQLLPSSEPHSKLIRFVEDRAGHDFRYALDTKKIKKELNWKSSYSFSKSLKLTISWYITNKLWLKKAIRKEKNLKKNMM